MGAHSNDEKFRSLKNIILILTINVVAALTLLLLTEYVLKTIAGSFDPRTNRSVNLLEYGSNSEGIVVPTLGKLAVADSLKSKRYRIRTNADGFIQPSNSHDNPDVSIVFLGGSTTASLFVTEDKRWPALAGKLLERKSGLKVSTANSGRQGNNSMHSNILLIAKILPLTPDIVVLMHNINDFGILHNEGSYWNQNLRRGIVHDDDGTLAVQMFRFAVNIKNEYFLNVYIALRSLLGMEKLGQWLNPTENWSTQTPLRPEHIKKQFRNSLRTFVQISRSWNVIPVLMTQANRFRKNQSQDQSKAGERQSQILRAKRIDEVEFYSLYSQMNQIVRDLARKENVPLIDLDKELPKTSTYLYDMIHLNDVGSEYQAQIVSRELLPILCAVTLKCSQGVEVASDLAE